MLKKNQREIFAYKLNFYREGVFILMITICDFSVWKILSLLFLHDNTIHIPINLSTQNCVKNINLETLSVRKRGYFGLIRSKVPFFFVVP